jgi:hypothetical protein
LKVLNFGVQVDDGRTNAGATEMLLLLLVVVTALEVEKLELELETSSVVEETSAMTGSTETSVAAGSPAKSTAAGSILSRPFRGAAAAKELCLGLDVFLEWDSVISTPDSCKKCNERGLVLHRDLSKGRLTLK